MKLRTLENMPDDRRRTNAEMNQSLQELIDQEESESKESESTVRLSKENELELINENDGPKERAFDQGKSCKICDIRRQMVTF